MSFIEHKDEKVTINYGKIVRGGTKILQVGVGAASDVLGLARKGFQTVSQSLEDVSKEPTDKLTGEFYGQVKEKSVEAKTEIVNYWRELEEEYHEWQEAHQEDSELDAQYQTVYETYLREQRLKAEQERDLREVEEKIADLREKEQVLDEAEEKIEDLYNRAQKQAEEYKEVQNGFEKNDLADEQDLEDNEDLFEIDEELAEQLEKESIEDNEVL